MKIGIAASGIYPFDFGGHEIRMHELGRRLAEDNEVHFFVPEREPGKYPSGHEGFYVHPIKVGLGHPIFTYTINALIFSFKVRKRLSAGNFQVVDLPYYSYPFSKDGTRVISTNGAFLSSFGHRSFLRRLLTFPILVPQITLTRLKTNFSDRVICVSEIAEEETMEHFGASEEKTVVIKNGVSENFEPEVDAGNLRSELGYSDEDFVLLYAGRLNQEKGVQDMIEAIKRIDDPQVKGLIMGGGKHRDRLEEVAEPAGDKIKFSGLVDYQEMPKYYSIGDLFILPSYWEIQPLACVEAMACGVPVIAAGVGGVSEIVKDGENGILVPPKEPKRIAEEIIRLKENDSLRQKFIENGLEFAEERTWDRIAEETLDVYESLLK